jgi:hypothetical protein
MGCRVLQPAASTSTEMPRHPPGLCGCKFRARWRTSLLTTHSRSQGVSAGVCCAAGSAASGPVRLVAAPATSWRAHLALAATSRGGWLSFGYLPFLRLHVDTEVAPEPQHEALEAGRGGAGLGRMGASRGEARGASGGVPALEALDTRRDSETASITRPELDGLRQQRHAPPEPSDAQPGLSSRALAAPGRNRRSLFVSRGAEPFCKNGVGSVSEL